MHNCILLRAQLRQRLTNHGGASCQGSTSARVEVVNGNRAHERQLHMGVGVNATCK